jgi:hypothetical protein
MIFLRIRWFWVGTHMKNYLVHIVWKIIRLLPYCTVIKILFSITSESFCQVIIDTKTTKNTSQKVSIKWMLYHWYC